MYQQAIVIEADNPKLFFDISECYSNNNDLDKALSTFDNAIKLDSLNPNFYNNRGLVYWNKKQTEACETFKLAKKSGLPADFITSDNHLTALQESCK